jgi:hypothetical protein
VRTLIALGTLLLLKLIVGHETPSRAAGADDALSEEVVRFESDGATLHGTVLVPEDYPAHTD